MRDFVYILFGVLWGAGITITVILLILHFEGA